MDIKVVKKASPFKIWIEICTNIIRHVTKIQNKNTTDKSTI